MVIATNSDAFIQNWDIADQHERAVLDLITNEIILKIE
jgi:hypothetical protein